MTPFRDITPGDIVDGMAISHPTAFLVRPDTAELRDEIDKRAKAVGMSRNQWIIKALRYNLAQPLPSPQGTHAEHPGKPVARTPARTTRTTSRNRTTT